MGYLAISCAAVLWAAGGTAARTLIDAGASAVELTEARAWIAAAGIGAYLLLRRGRGPARDTSVPAWLVVAFGLSIAAANVTYYLALARLPVAVAIVVQYTAPGLVVLWAGAVQRRRPSRRVVAALVFAFAGVVLLAELRSAIVDGRTALDPAGLAIAVASAIAFSVYMISGERVGRALGSGRSVFYGFCVAGVFWLGVQIARGRPDTLLDPRFWHGIAFLAVFTTIAPFLLFVYGLERVDASRAGVISTLEPLTAAVLAYVFLGQTLRPVQAAGAAMVVAGIAIVQSERPASRTVLEERAAIE